MIVPITAFCQNVCTPSRFMPLMISARMTEPTAVPMMPPTPPNRDVPPRQTAAIAGSSKSSPRPESAAFMRAITTSAANPDEQPTQAVDRDQAPRDRHAGQTRGVRIAADRVDGAAEHGLVQQEMQGGEQCRGDDYWHRNAPEEACADEAEAFGEPVDHLALHEDVAESESDPEHAVGRDEGRDTADRHEHAVHQPAGEAGEERGGDAEQS